MARHEPPPQLAPKESIPLSIRLADDAAAQVRTLADDHLGRLSLQKQVSTTVPVHVLALIEVLAERLGKSRGAMIAWASEIGGNLILDRMDRESRYEIDQVIQARQAQLEAELNPYDQDE